MSGIVSLVIGVAAGAVIAYLIVRLDAERAIRRAAERTTDVLRESLHDARAEVRRLTDVVIHMKDQGKLLPPEATDDRWGAYVIDDDLELEEEQRRERAAERARARAEDAQVRKILEDL